MGLQEYQRKRDFKKTLEPRGRKSRSKEKNIFVVQKHAASRLHYDFRLELDGVLKSWAVPKGPSLNPKDKRLAVEVEDHPMDYAYFEGSIPEGQYGGGDVIVWDKGEWIPPKNALAQLEKGHLKFELHGQKLSGHWVLVRTRKNQWLLIKEKDEFVSDEDILEQDKSVLTGLELPQKRKKTKARRKMPDFISPQLALLSEVPPSGDNWLHEIKFDGYRTLCHKKKNDVKLFTRSGLNWSSKYKSLQKECEKISHDCILDGEIVWVDENGISHFQGLQNSLDSHKSDDLLYYVFDLLYLDGEDLRDRPLLDRKRLLAEIVKETDLKKILLSDHWAGSGKDILTAACKMNLEGIVSKNADATYDSNRNKNWIKSKCSRLQEFVIGGYTHQKKNKSLGSLLMGAYNAQGEFQYIGRVGTGFNSPESTKLLNRLKKLAAVTSPFEQKSPKESDIRFVKPQLVAQIEFGAWTDEKILRHAAYKGLRLDKKAKSVKLEEDQLKKPEQVEISISTPDKILYPKARLTKKQLADYYQTMHKWIMPYVKQRPLALLRCPNGVGKACFFQKHKETDGFGILSKNVQSRLKEKKETVLYIDSELGLQELVQLGTLEIHARGCLVYQIDHPNIIVFDLDPSPEVGFIAVKKAALKLKDLLARLKLKSYLLVSGGKGLHLHVPIQPDYDYDAIKNFSKAVCDQLVKENPGLYTTELKKTHRTQKIFLDYLRNGYGATAIIPYSVRAQSEATVALPISWTELKKIKSAKEFTVNAVLKKLKRSKDPWPDYFKIKQKIMILDAIQRNTKPKNFSEY